MPQRQLTDLKNELLRRELTKTQQGLETWYDTNDLTYPKPEQKIKGYFPKSNIVTGSEQGAVEYGTPEFADSIAPVWGMEPSEAYRLMREEAGNDDYLGIDYFIRKHNELNKRDFLNRSMLGQDTEFKNEDR